MFIDGGGENLMDFFFYIPDLVSELYAGRHIHDKFGANRTRWLRSVSFYLSNRKKKNSQPVQPEQAQAPWPRIAKYIILGKIFKMHLAKRTIL